MLAFSIWATVCWTMSGPSHTALCPEGGATRKLSTSVPSLSSKLPTCPLPKSAFPLGCLLAPPPSSLLVGRRASLILSGFAEQKWWTSDELPEWSSSLPGALVLLASAHPAPVSHAPASRGLLEPTHGVFSSTYHLENQKGIKGRGGWTLSKRAFCWATCEVEC